MDVEIWVDLVCPWCYLGKRRFETALAEVGGDHFRVVWRSFELEPDRPRSYDGLLIDELTRQTGDRAEAEAKLAKVTELAAGDGLDYALDKARPANTRDAHRLVHYARSVDAGTEAGTEAGTDAGTGAGTGVRTDNATIERLMRAYATEGRSLDDTETLVELASEVGLDADDVRATLAGATFDAEVLADRARARELGITGVPAYVLGTYGMSGAQPPAVFSAMLKTLKFIG